MSEHEYVKWNGRKSNVINLSNKDFKDDKLNKFKGKFCLLKVYAKWCGYCRMMYSDINFLADNLPKKDFKVCALDFDDNMEIAQKLGVNGFPSLFMVDEKGVLEKLELNNRSIENILDVICSKTEKYNKNKKVCLK